MVTEILICALMLTNSLSGVVAERAPHMAPVCGDFVIPDFLSGLLRNIGCEGHIAGNEDVVVINSKRGMFQSYRLEINTGAQKPFFERQTFSANRIYHLHAEKKYDDCDMETCTVLLQQAWSRLFRGVKIRPIAELQDSSDTVIFRSSPIGFANEWKIECTIRKVGERSYRITLDISRPREIPRMDDDIDVDVVL